VIKWMLAILADLADKFLARRFSCRQSGRLPAESGWKPNLHSEHFIPLALVLEHDLAQEPNRWHAVVEQLIVELLQ